MKKILIVFLLCAIRLLSFAQPGVYPVTQNLASPTTLLQVGTGTGNTNGGGGLKVFGGIIPAIYADTAHANLISIINYPGAEIATGSGDSLWVRYNNKWNLISVATSTFGAIPTLDQVLTSGNISTQDAIVGAVIMSDFTTSLASGLLTIKSTTTSGNLKIGADNVGGGHSLNLEAPNVSGTNTIPISVNGNSANTTTGDIVSVTLTTTGTSGASTFNPATGALNIPNYATGSGGSVSLPSGSIAVAGSNNLINNTAVGKPQYDSTHKRMFNVKDIDSIALIKFNQDSVVWLQQGIIKNQGPFNFTIDSTFINPDDSTHDQVVQWGWNQNGGGGIYKYYPHDSAQLHWSMEQNYNNGVQHQFEVELESLTPKGGTIRHEAWNISRQNGSTYHESTVDVYEMRTTLNTLHPLYYSIAPRGGFAYVGAAAAMSITDTANARNDNFTIQVNPGGIPGNTITTSFGDFNWINKGLHFFNIEDSLYTEYSTSYLQTHFVSNSFDYKPSNGSALSITGEPNGAGAAGLVVFSFLSSGSFTNTYLGNSTFRFLMSDNPSDVACKFVTQGNTDRVDIFNSGNVGVGTVGTDNANGILQVSGGNLAIEGGNSILHVGSGSGVISEKTQAAAGTYNWNLPTTAGTSGQYLTSQGGGSSAMTWTTLPSTPVVVKSNYISGQTSAQTIVTTTSAAADTSYQINAYVDITALSAGVVTTFVTYTPEGASTPVTATFFTQGATSSTLVLGPSNYPPISIRCKASTTITVGTTVTVGTATYNAKSSIILTP